jgi:hypothetical protein
MQLYHHTHRHSLTGPRLPHTKRWSSPACSEGAPSTYTMMQVVKLRNEDVPTSSMYGIVSSIHVIFQRNWLT